MLTNKNHRVRVVKSYNLFISHSWKYNAEYYAFERLLIWSPFFYFQNLTDPAYSPRSEKNTRSWEEELLFETRKTIKSVDCVVILADIYVQEPFWVEKQIVIANEYKKPIIFVLSRKNNEVPSIIKGYLDKVINWDMYSVVNAIKEYGAK